MMFLPELEIAGYTLKPVNLLSDVGVSSSKLHSPLIDEEPLMLDTIPEIKPAFQEEHPKGMTIIEDFSRQEGDSVFFVGRGMDHFYEMLGKSRELARPVRIAYFGDSFIEGDILTDQLRADLQSEFGGEGVGFIDMASPTAGFRQSVRAYSKGWYAHSITDSVRFDRSRQGLAERFYVPIGRAYTNVNGIPNRKNKHQARFPMSISVARRVCLFPSVSMVGKRKLLSLWPLKRFRLWVSAERLDGLPGVSWGIPSTGGIRSLESAWMAKMGWR